jgi:hypothetical protein
MIYVYNLPYYIYFLAFLDAIIYKNLLFKIFNILSLLVIFNVFYD